MVDSYSDSYKCIRCWQMSFDHDVKVLFCPQHVEIIQKDRIWIIVTGMITYIVNIQTFSLLKRLKKVIVCYLFYFYFF